MRRFEYGNCFIRDTELKLNLYLEEVIDLLNCQNERIKKLNKRIKELEEVLQRENKIKTKS